MMAQALEPAMAIAERSANSRTLLLVAPLLALLYPYALVGFHRCVSAIRLDASRTNHLAVAAAGGLLLAAFVSPIGALISATRLSALADLTKAEARAMDSDLGRGRASHVYAHGRRGQ